MDLIKKKINLEQVINRFSPEHWGEIGGDFWIDEGEPIWQDRKTIPLIEEMLSGDTSYRLRYRTAVNLNTYLRNFYNNVDIYQFCKRKGKMTLIKQDFMDLSNIDVLYSGVFHIEGTVPTNAKTYVLLSGDTYTEIDADGLKVVEEDIEDMGAVEAIRLKGSRGVLYFIEKDEADAQNSVKYGDYLCVYPDFSRLIITFPRGCDNDMLLGAKNFYEYVNGRITEGGDAVGYLDFPLYLSETIKDIGDYTYIGETEKKINSDIIPDLEFILPQESVESGSTVSGYTSSKLANFKRYSVSCDDYGEELPFLLVYDTNNKEEVKLVEAEEGVYKTDILYDSGTTAVTETGINIITFSGIFDGVTYTERYGFEEKIEQFEVTIGDDKSPKMFKYIDILFDMPYDLEGNPIEKPKCFISFNIDENYELDSVYIKEEAKMGFAEANVDAADLHIERGTSAAFERHNALGDIATMDDLETYKNGFFIMKDDENNY